MDDNLPSARDVLDTHDEVVARWELKYPGVRVAAPRLKFQRLLEGVAGYDGVYIRAGHLLRDLTTAHYFEDGNKRTAWLTVRDYLDQHGLEPAERGERAERVMRRLRRYEAEELAKWLETGEIDEDRLHP